MKFTVKQRLVMQSVLPDRSNIIMLKMMRKLKEELSFSDKEIKKYNLRREQNGEGGYTTVWDQEEAEKEKPKNIKVEDALKDEIKKRLQEMDKKKQLTEDHIDLWDKFKCEPST